MQSDLMRNLLVFLSVYWLGIGLLAAQEAANTAAPTIRQILFVGNEHLSTQEAQEILSIRPGETYEPHRLEAQLDSLLSAYRERGHAFATVTPQIMQLGADQVQIILVIAENAQVKLGDFEVTGSERLSPDELKKELGWRVGQLVNSDRISTGIEGLLSWYSELGHPRVEIQLQNVRYAPETGRVSFELSVTEGPAVRISGIEVQGLQKTRPKVVQREIPLQIGETYDQRRVDASVRRLERLGYFYSIAPVVLAEGKSADEIRFQPQVTEARTGRVSGILGYARAEEESEAQLTGMLEAQETNLFGTGRKLGVSWKSGLLSSYEISYEEPWVLGHRIHLGFALAGMNQEDRLTQATSGENGGRFRLRVGLSETLEASTSLSYERLRLPGADEEQTKYSVALGISRDSRDSILNPTKGRLDEIRAEYTVGDFRLRKLWMSTQQYVETWPKQVVALGVHVARIWGEPIPPTELLYLGGANTLRGYNEDWFRGPARVSTNLEYRFLVGRSSQFFLFLDTGSVSEVERATKLGNLHLGYGFGMRLESKAGSISVHYGIPQDAGALDGKIHVSIAPLF